MDKNKDIIWQMSRDYKPGKDLETFKIILDKSFYNKTDIKFKLVDGTIKEVFNPYNFWHKIKQKLGLAYKEKSVGWEYEITKTEE